MSLPETGGKMQMQFRHFAHLSHLQLKARRRAGEIVDSAHAEWHLKRVAAWADPIGEAYGFPPRVVELAKIAALFHDVFRSPRQDLGLKDEEASAQRAVHLLEHPKMQKLFVTTDEERKAVSYAIIHHGETPTLLKNTATRNDIPETLADKLHVVLYISDGLEKLGEPLIMRRSAFVGGKRLSEGDLKEVTYTGTNARLRQSGGKLDPIKAILLESAIRIGWKNVEDVYPEQVRPHVEPAYATQRDWVAGLLAAEGLTVEAWVDMVMNTINTRGQNSFQFSGINPPPASVQEVVSILKGRGGMTDEIIQRAAQDTDLVTSSVEAASHFSSQYDKSPEEALEKWKPRRRLAKAWKNSLETPKAARE